MRIWPVVYGAACLVSTVSAIWAVLHGSPVPAPLLILPAVAITAMCLLFLRGTRRLSPPHRARTLSAECWKVCLIVYVAQLVPGDWVVRFWNEHPWLEQYQFWLALALVYQVLTPLGDLGGWPGILLLAATDKGLFAFLLGLFAADLKLATFAALMAGLSVPIQLKMVRELEGPGSAPRRLDARRFSEGTDDYRRKVLRSWAGTALRRHRPWPAVVAYRLVRGPWLRPRAFGHRRFAEGTRRYGYDRRRERLEAWRRLPPDLALIHGLCLEGSLSVMSSKPPPRLDENQPTADRHGAAALHWPGLADELLGLVRTSHPHPGPRERRAIDLAVAAVAETRGNIYVSLGRKEEALVEKRNAWRLRVEHGLVNLVVDDLAAQAAAVVGTVSQMMLPDDVLRELTTLREHPRLVPFTRRMLLIGISTCHLALGEQRLAMETRRAGQAVPVRRRDVLRIVREARQADVLPGSPRFYLEAATAWERLNVSHAKPFDVSPYSLDLGGRNMPPMVMIERYSDEEAKKQARAGIQLWMSGHHLEGAALLRQSVDILLGKDLSIHAYLILLNLGYALSRIDAGEAYADLSRAFDIQQRLRGAVQGPDLRLTSGADTERLASVMIGLLAEAGPRPGAPWPERRAVAAFELSEKARSRVLLELLGETAGRPEEGDPISYDELREFLRAETVWPGARA
ncbi:hypothetical protein OG339_35725 [Streptosporangium sp. NBC_01495]|uniref:hypothetical protein n=1 Tax=Streptosporangium sp. NBC_01495 TaxID=2903899 RepID=UPI002E316047|nr:hypothetical protein [Streptosporangium sp. NBC_01495]